MEKWNDEDKILHFLVNVILAFYSTEGAVFASLAKEFGDKGNPSNHWCWGDIAADMVGALAGTLLRLGTMICISGHWSWNWIN